MLNSNDNSMPSKSNLAVHFSLFLTVVFWGLSFVAIKIVLQSFSPFVYVFLRFSLASLFFLIYLLCRGFPTLDFNTHKKLMLLALFEPSLYFTLETLGLTYTTASKASIIIATVPIIVMILDHVIFKEAISRRNVMGILLSFLGITVLVVGEPGFTWSLDGTLYGDLLIMAAVISTSFYMIVARSLGKTLSSVEITSFQMFYGTLFFAPLFLLQLPSTSWSGISLQSIIALIFLTICATIGGFLCYNYALTKITTSSAAVVQNGIPLVTALAAWIILGETLTAVQISGGLLALFGVLWTNLGQRKRKLFHPQD